MAKVDIYQLVTKDDLRFTLGQTAADVDGGELFEVERIFYEKNGYNKGRQGEFAAYVVMFAGRNTRVVIPESEVKRFVAIFSEEDRNTKPAPDLPD